MKLLREGLPALLGAATATALLGLALAPRSGREAVFAATFLCLLAAACCGPFLFGQGLRRAARRGLWLAASAASVCLLMAMRHQGPYLGALLCGLFCGLYGFALGSAARIAGGGVAAVACAGLGVALLFSLHYWDSVALLHASDRKASAALAFQLNPAAAASVTLGFDWIHAKALYTNNQTAESLFGVPLPGLGAYSIKLVLIAGAALLAGLWRRR